jgi:ubiquinol-cytochrome c reductase cytochrome c subunit
VWLVASAGALTALEWITPIVLAGTAAMARRRRDALLLAAAAVVTFIAVSPPLHSLAHASVTGHMAQHLLIIVVAAPLVGAVLAAAPGRWRKTSPARTLFEVGVRPTAAPLVAGAVHALVVLGWHHPTLYDAAVDTWFLHGIEHLLMLSSGAWWWSAVFHHAARSSIITPALSLFGVATLCAVLGVLMMFAPEPLYGQGGTVDQQIAGALMAGIAGAVYMGSALVLFATGVHQLAEPRRGRVPAAARRGAGPGTLGSRSLMVAALVALGAAVVGYQTQGSAPQAAASPADGHDLGRELYRRDCAACHGPAGEGTFRGVSIVDTGTASVYFTLATGRMPIPHPDATIRRQAPAYTSDQINAIVDYTATFVDGPEIPTIDPAAADLARGGVHYRLHCAACHSATGIGGTQAFGREAPPVLHSTVTETAAAIVAGPGGMPAFRATFTDDEIAGVAAYVQLLQDPPTTGIAIPGGRVGEGLVAWLVGIGALLFAISWIGRRV